MPLPDTDQSEMHQMLQSLQGGQFPPGGAYPFGNLSYGQIGVGPEGQGQVRQPEIDMLQQGMPDPLGGMGQIRQPEIDMIKGGLPQTGLPPTSLQPNPQIAGDVLRPPAFQAPPPTAGVSHADINQLLKALSAGKVVNHPTQPPIGIPIPNVAPQLR
jgi:hypothetical protein